jgi:hypothetical protein
MKENYIEKVNETKEVMNFLCNEQANISEIKEEIKKNNKTNTEILVIYLFLFAYMMKKLLSSTFIF